MIILANYLIMVAVNQAYNSTERSVYAYDGLGNTLSASGPLKDVNPCQFSTNAFEANWNTYYYLYRFYSPELGRWLSRDSIGEKGGLNLYGFVDNDGVNRWDLLGMKDCLCIRFAKETYENEWWHNWERLSLRLHQVCSTWDGTLNPSSKGNFDCPLVIFPARFAYDGMLKRGRKTLLADVRKCCKECHGVEESDWQSENCGCRPGDEWSITQSVPVQFKDVGYP